MLPGLAAQGSYGLLIVAPYGDDCHLRRYAVLDNGMRVVAKSGPVPDGQNALLRLGRGAIAGDLSLTLRVMGCGGAPERMRVVRLGKMSPDMGSSVAMARSGHRNAKIATLVAAVEPEAKLVDRTLSYAALGIKPAASLEDRRRIKRHRAHQIRKAQAGS
ncbi:MAG: hypothetical protein ABI832_11580 [bacterium]